MSSPVDKYITLVRFLMEPLLSQPDTLKVNCESNSKGDRIWIRVAFNASEKGRIFGRNGRTIQAIRTLLTTAANSYDQIVRFDVFDPELSEAKPTDKPVSRSAISKPKPKPKSE